jgi:hypothetical protein
MTRVLRVVFAISVLAAPVRGSGAQDRVRPHDVRHDIDVIDRALAAAHPDDPWVTFGDIGIRYEDLRAYRDRLAAVTAPVELMAVAPPGTTFKWPGGNVYYRFDPAQVGNGTITPLKMEQFRDGVAEWAAFANLHFIESVTGQPHYITVQEDPALGGGFSSSVGMDPINAEQFVRFGPGAWNRGTVCHEVGHALAFFHEQQRPDRDTYVVINWDNIDPGNQPNFTTIAAGVTYGTPYDFYSVMHYRRDALSANAEDTISMQPAYAAYIDVIGNVYDRPLSKNDRAGIAAIYGNPTTPPSGVVTNTNDGGSGSLRTAIYYAFDRSTDAVPVPTTVTFHIPTSDPNYNAATGVFTIRPTASIPALGSGTTIDGSSQAAFAGDTNLLGPEIMLDGSKFALLQGPLGIYAHGLILRAANCVVKGLTIANFNLSGIELSYVFDPNGTAATGNVIGGTTASARNVISGNAQYGMVAHDAATSGNVIAGNYVGIDQAGTAPQPNGIAGVVIHGGAHGNTVGGTVPGAGNVISGNVYHGVYIGDAGTNANVVQGNFIGTNASGIGSVPNLTGLEITLGAHSNVIGTPGAGNVISGNDAQGIIIGGTGTAQNLVQGNSIGVDATGAAALSNGSAGVSIYGDAQSNTIGGLAPSAGNVISGNFYQGVTLDGANTSLNLVQGNIIGLNKNGTIALPNGSAGMSVYGGAHDNTIGGTAIGARNVISGNTYQGLTIDGAGTNANVIQGNTIGLSVSGGTVANGSQGVALFAGAQSNLIGGSAPGASNIVSGSTYDGIAMYDATTLRNTVSQNAIFANNFAGMSLSGGANNSQPAPGLSAAVLGAPGNTGGTDVGGTLMSSAANTVFRIEFFANPPGNDEGQIFVGSATVTTNGGGTATFTSPPIHLTAAIPRTYLVTATATDPTGNTSILSATTPVTGVDTDSDGMPDNWENAHLLNAASAADADIDSDHDGFSNLQEFKDGTDPQNPASRLTIFLDRSAGNARVSFQAIAGKTYRLEFRDDLIAGGWRLLANGMSSPTTTNLQLADNGSTAAALRFYRVTTEP